MPGWLCVHRLHHEQYMETPAKLIGHEELINDPELYNDLSRFEHRTESIPWWRSDQ